MICPAEIDFTIPTAGNWYPTLHICWDQEKRGIGVTVKQSWNLSPSTIQPIEVLNCGPAAPRTFKDGPESSACRPAIWTASALKRRMLYMRQRFLGIALLVASTAYAQ